MLNLNFGDLMKLTFLGIVGLLLVDAFLELVRDKKQLGRNRSSTITVNLNEKDLDWIVKKLKKDS